MHAVSKNSSNRFAWIAISGAVIVWCFVLFYFLSPSKRSRRIEGGSTKELSFTLRANSQESAATVGLAAGSRDASSASYFTHRDFQRTVKPPQRYLQSEAVSAMAPLEEVERNMTLYLRTLHEKFQSMAGPTGENHIIGLPVHAYAPS